MGPRVDQALIVDSGDESDGSGLGHLVDEFL